jgi:hypothetical protein
MPQDIVSSTCLPKPLSDAWLRVLATAANDVPFRCGTSIRMLTAGRAGSHPAGLLPSYSGTPCHNIS